MPINSLRKDEGIVAFHVQQHIAKMLNRLKTDPTDIVAATQLTRNLIKLTEGIHYTVIWTDHVVKELENDGCDMLDALHALETGQIFEPPEWDNKCDVFKYRVHGKTIDNEEVVVVEVILNGDDSAIIGIKHVTFWKKKKR